jgi:hypothetical protein
MFVQSASDERRELTPVAEGDEKPRCGEDPKHEKESSQRRTRFET